MSLKFIKQTEDFKCEHCQALVLGNGFTNHCPECLWSKHVDFYPGDRAHHCEGLMAPLRLEPDKGKTVLIHRCLTCKEEKRNKTGPNDQLDVLLDKMV